MASLLRGTPKKDGSPTWRLKYSLQLGSKRIWKSESFDRHADAKRRKAEVEVSIEKKGIGDPFRLTLGTYLDRWFLGLVQDDQHSPSTLASYRSQITTVKTFLAEVPLAKLTPDHIREAYRDMRICGGRSGGTLKAGEQRRVIPLSKTTVGNVHKMLAKALQDACPPRSRLIPENPARGVAPPAADPSPVARLTDEQMAAMWRAAQAKQEARQIYDGIDLIFLLLVTSGIRRCEALGLMWSEIDLERGDMTVRRSVVRGLDGVPILRAKPKTKSSRRTIRIDAAVVALLKRHRAVIGAQRAKWPAGLPDLVFPERDGGVMQPLALTNRIREVQKAAGVTYLSPCHALRHTHISVLLDSGAPLKVVSARAGHARVGITADLYGHVSEAADEAASDTFAAHFSKVVEEAKNATKMPPQPVERWQKRR